MSQVNSGIEFEEEFADEMGLTPVPGSGSQWHSKLDVYGKGARWSLKYRSSSFRIDKDFIDEAIDATEGMGGTGEIPLWAVRLGSSEYDLVILRKDDFKKLAAGDLKVIGENKKRSELITGLADVPSLLRDQDEPNRKED